MNDEKFYILQYLTKGKGLPLQAAAREIGVSAKTSRNWLKKNQPPSHKAVRQCPQTRRIAIQNRQQLVKRLINEKEDVVRVKFSPVIRKEQRRVITRKRFPTPAAVSKELRRRRVLNCSKSTVRRDLLQLGCKARRQRKAPFLTERHKKQRLEFCSQKHGPLLFSDEKLITSNTHSHGWEWVEPGQLPLPRSTEQGSARVMLWAVIGKGFRHLQIIPDGSITAAKYQRECIKPALPKLREATKTKTFTQDNARPHCGSLDYMRRSGVRVCPFAWPALSPDLNPVEQLWHILATRVSSRAPYGVADLIQAVKSEWNAIPQRQINALVSSFPSRCKRVTAAKGETIKP